MPSNQGRHLLKKTIAVLFILSLVASPCQAADPLTVTRVMDGDTMQLSGGDTVRLLGIDCEENEYRPEEAVYLDTGKKWERSPDSLKRAKEAAEFTRMLVEGKQVRLEYDVQKKDKYGRTLAYVYIFAAPGRPKINGITGYEYVYLPDYDAMFVFLNATLVKSGYAQVMTSAFTSAGEAIPLNVKYQELFVKLEKEAREQKRGLWR